MGSTGGMKVGMTGRVTPGWDEGRDDRRCHAREFRSNAIIDSVPLEGLKIYSSPYWKRWSDTGIYVRPTVAKRDTKAGLVRPAITRCRGNITSTSSDS